MKSNHYPSLELCKKLQEVGFPVTEKVFVLKVTTSEPVNRISEEYGECRYDYVCPSVMEMLDVMPGAFMKEGTDYYLEISKCLWTVMYSSPRFETHLAFYKGNIPDSLAEMVLWLVENKHLTFKPLWAN